ncbi:hypothetical protein ACP6PL_26445 [Dapis sp. BLCC M126]|uniref:hypothetical protein n=1 Tax=Dapis sp. BLCC M126 TaxID=3400189 RepID=UPI003CEFAF77
MNHNLVNLTSMNAIYDYLYQHFIDNRNVTEQQKLEIQSRFSHRPCLWDESTNKFWQPKHTFQVEVPFFGTRRICLTISHPLAEVYQLLGQRKSPTLTDYIDFIQEIAEESGSSPLNDVDKTCIIQVFQRLEAQLYLEKGSIKNLPILNAENQLIPANKILIPDAHWWIDYIDNSRLLHPQVSLKLAKLAGSLSLLKDVIEIPKNVQPADENQSNEWCRKWQNTLNSPKFLDGLQRLIFHYHDSELQIDINLLKTAKVVPANQIDVDLVLQDKSLVASSIPGVYYFDANQKIFYITASANKYIMLCYLAEILNSQLESFSLDNLLPLTIIIDAEPENIRSLLDELRIRSFQNQEIVDVNLSSDSTDTKNSNNQIYWGAF